MKQPFSKCARWSWIISSILALLPMAAFANDCARMERLGPEWGANLSTFDSAKQRYFSLSDTQRVPARCDYWKSYLHYLQNAKRMIDEYDRNTCPEKFSKVECDAACFAARAQDAEKQVQRACSPDSVAQANACAVAVGKYSAGHDVLLKKRREMTSRSDELEFDKKDKAAAIKVDCERLKWDWTTYQPFLRRELKVLEDTCGDGLFDFFFADKKTFRGSEYFTHTQPATTRKELAEICKINADTLTVAAPPPTVARPTVVAESPKVAAPPSVTVTTPTVTPSPTVRTTTPTVQTPRLSHPSPSASCSDITGTSSNAPAATSCATARKALTAARDDRQKYPQRAAKKYQDAAGAFRQAGDQPRATLALRESTTSDPAPFIAAEADLAQRAKNIEEAENNARIARKIEEGAFESGSCADLQRAADYYLDAAKYFMRADQFAVVNAVLLRKDHLERLVDEAKRKGLCNKRLATRRTGALTSPSPLEDRLPADQCRSILDHIRRAPDLQQGGSGAALLVELASKGCKDTNAPALTASQCQLASIAWSVRDVGMEEIDRRLKAAACPCEVRGGEVRCDGARPATVSTSQPNVPAPSTAQTPAAKSTAPDTPKKQGWDSWLWQNKEGK